jgi:hypothetical protein
MRYVPRWQFPFFYMLVGHDQDPAQPGHGSGSRTIEVESAEVGLLDCDISRKRLEEFYDKGYAAVQQFLSSWDWPEYLDHFTVFPMAAGCSGLKCSTPQI